MKETQKYGIRAALLNLVQQRGTEKSICPSEVARTLSAEWRPLLPAVRQEAVRLMQEGRIDILRKGKAVEDPGQVRGVIRLRLRDTTSS